MAAEGAIDVDLDAAQMRVLGSKRIVGNLGASFGQTAEQRALAAAGAAEDRGQGAVPTVRAHRRVELLDLCRPRGGRLDPFARQAKYRRPARRAFPADAAPDAMLPLIVELHGGPTAATQDRFRAFAWRETTSPYMDLSEGLDAYVVRRLGLPFRDVDRSRGDSLLDSWDHCS